MTKDATLLLDIRSFLEHHKDWKVIQGPPHKNDAWKLIDRIDAELAASGPPTYPHGHWFRNGVCIKCREPEPVKP